MGNVCVSAKANNIISRETSTSGLRSPKEKRSDESSEHNKKNLSKIKMPPIKASSTRAPSHVKTEEKKALIKEESSDTSSRTEDDMEKEIQTMLHEEERKLKKKARPLLDRRTSVEILGNVMLAFKTKEDTAATRIQRCARRMLARNEVKAKEKWLLFCGADSALEAFKITSSDIPNMALQSYSLQLDETDEFEAILGHRESARRISDPSLNVISFERQKSMEKFLRLEKIIHGDINDYTLPVGHITPRMAAEVIEVYKRGGRLNIKSVHKILRLSYRILKKLPNIVNVKVGPDDKLTVVGDIHGQLTDLFHILDHSGMPKSYHKYIFNGDFVDRGFRGVEVMCVLLSLLIAMPENIVLNRGNHEDFAVCCLYGFQTECCSKYDEVTFGMFSELFQHLPLFSIVNDAVFVVHGGLFHRPDVTLNDLLEIKRSEFSLRDVKEEIPPPPSTPSPQLTAHDGDDESESLLRETNKQRDLYLHKLQRDALWSDPQAATGYGTSGRGVGVTFGPDITRTFLEKNGLKMIIRSHECVFDGFSKPFPGEDADLLGTIFSASNYGGGKNTAAYLSFYTYNIDGSHRVREADLWYKINIYQIVDTSLNQSEKESNEASTPLIEMIQMKEKELRIAFEAKDINKTGEVSKLEWAEVMLRITGLKIRWLTMIPFLVAEDYRKTGGIDYSGFLSFFMSIDRNAI